MAQYIGLAPAQVDMPGPRMTIAPIPTAAATTTADIPSPTVTNRAATSALSDPSSSSRTPTSDRIKQAATLTRTYGLEAAPAAAVATFTSLGWLQHYTAHAGLEAFGTAGLAVGSGFIAAHGIKNQNHHLFVGGAGVAVALADAAAATQFGLTPASLIMSAISTALGYWALVPWLIQHRKVQRQAAGQDASAQQRKQAPPPRPGGEVGSEDPDEAPIYLPDTAPIVPLHNPFHDDVIPYADDLSNDVRDPIHIGYDEYGNPVYLTMLYRHTLITGATDWGKSGGANLIIKKLLKKKHVEVYGIDLKPGAPELGPWEPVLKKLARTPEEARELLEDYLAEGAGRGEHLARLSKASLASGGPAVKKWIPGDPSAPARSPQWGHGTAKYLIIDELGELIRQDILLRKMEQEERRLDPENAPPASPPVETRLESSLAMLRFVAMHIVSATQQASARVFGGNTDQRGNYGNRMSTRVNDAEHAQFLFGKNWKKNGFNPKLLTRPGEIFLGCPEMPEENPPKVRLMFVSDDDVAADVGHLHAASINEPIGRFAPQGRLSLVKVQEPPKVPPAAAAPKVLFPDDTEVRRGDWLDLYKVFLRLCAEHGYATKDTLTEHGPYDSRDTVRRALEHWLTRGVQVRKVNRTNQFYLPETASEDN